MNNYETVIKLLFLGNAGVGKSSLLARWQNESFNTSIPSTIGIDFNSKIVDITMASCDKPRRVKVNIWDTAGQERFRSIVYSYYRSGQGLILVYAINDICSFLNLSYWIGCIEKTNPEALNNMIIVGNKADKYLHRVISYEKGKEFADSHNAFFVETSAMENDKIKEGLLLLITKMAKDILPQPICDNTHIPTESDTVDVNCSFFDTHGVRCII